MKQNFLDFYKRMADEMSRKYCEATTSTEAERYNKEHQTYLKQIELIEKSLEKEAAKNA